MCHVYQVRLTTQSQWRRWLAANHDREREGVWLVFQKKATGKPCVQYEAAVEEALCFGWVDSLIKNINEREYCRKFTPRKDDSQWSDSNKKRVEKIIKEGRMTKFGLAKVEAAKRLRLWQKDPRPVISIEVSQEFSEALARNAKARVFFESLAPSYRKLFLLWIVTAKRPKTRARRIKESLGMLARRQKLGITSKTA